MLRRITEEESTGIILDVETARTWEPWEVNENDAPVSMVETNYQPSALLGLLSTGELRGYKTYHVLLIGKQSYCLN